MKIKFKISYPLVLIGLWALISLAFIDPVSREVLSDKETSKRNYHYFSKKNITDGPYIFMDSAQVKVKWIYKDRLKKRTVRNNNFKIIQRKFGFEFNPEWIEESSKEVSDYAQRYNNVNNLVAISDVHGQYDVMVKLLKQYNVIDDHYNWLFGDGHLVVLGDLLDRGPKVTESLWLIFRLEQQAEKAGGKVHVLLGNHEVMVLNNDLRYIHEKYIRSAKLMNTTYNKLYEDNTLIGRWLRKKPAMVTINEMLFVHAGVSIGFMTRGLTRTGTNKNFTERIVGGTWKTILEDSTLSFLMGEKGPIWFRGYFDYPPIMEYQVDHLLRYFNVKHIIVGHTSMPSIVSLFNNKILGIDSSIKYGDYGEILLYSDKKYYRGSINGTRIVLQN